MRVYGNIVNRVSEHTTGTPKVGDGCTICFWSDRQSATIIEVVSEREIIIQEDTSTRTDSNGMSESQTWEHAPNPNGVTYTFTKRKNGAWREKHHYGSSGHGLRIGHRDHYYDFSF